MHISKYVSSRIHVMLLGEWRREKESINEINNRQVQKPLIHLLLHSSEFPLMTEVGVFKYC